MGRLLWQERQDIGPAPRATALTFISSKARTLLFGGVSYVAPWYFGDTWEWDGEGWVQVADTGPDARASVKLSYDSDRNVTVLFGGYNTDGHQFDTWEWDGTGWTQVEDKGPQTQGWLSTMTYDAARKATVLEAGSVATKGVGTWGWDGTAWTQLADSGPSQRGEAGLAFDPIRERAVLFGGAPGGGPTRVQETWEWDGAFWTQVEDIGPSARQSHGMTWTGTAVLLFGGLAGKDQAKPAGDTWSWDGEHWQQRQDIGPSPRCRHGMAWDAARNRTVLFGGEINSNSSGDTWEAFEEP